MPSDESVSQAQENQPDLLYDPSTEVNPLGDGEELDGEQRRKNFAKVGSIRPSGFMYTYGPGSVMDLPHFTAMTMGLDDWEHIYERRVGDAPKIHAPRLEAAVRVQLGPQVEELRALPWQPKERTGSKEGDDLGIPARIFPQWFRCTGCDKLAPLDEFTYKNTVRARPDKAEFVHESCPGYGGKKRKNVPCVPARYMLACTQGHLDEFPYDWFVHEGQKCAVAPNHPDLRMHENASGRGSGAVIECASCGMKRAMNQVQGEAGLVKLPRCRGRYAHLNSFDRKGCDEQARLMLVGASNLWFPATQSIVDMPTKDKAERLSEILSGLKAELGAFADIALSSDTVNGFDTVELIMQAALKPNARPSLRGLSREDARAAIELYRNPPTAEQVECARRAWEPTDLLVPEWNYLQDDPVCERQREEASGLTLSPRTVAPELADMGVARVLAIDSLRKVNALIGFTRIDDYDRASKGRLVRLTRDGRPTWVPATEDRGEGIFLQLDEGRVAQWEQRVLDSKLWARHKNAYLNYYYAHRSDTADADTAGDPLRQLPAPRYWLVHGLAHALIRKMAMSSGYGIPSLSERLYAWVEKPEKDRGPAAGLIIMTTASDSDGTLGGLVALSEPHKMRELFVGALRDALRCSSDPVCGHRVPEGSESFLHGAACHCCSMVSETSCERQNRYLDRRFLVPLPGDCDGELFADLAFFGGVHV